MLEGGGNIDASRTGSRGRKQSQVMFGIWASGPLLSTVWKPQKEEGTDQRTILRFPLRRWLPAPQPWVVYGKLFVNEHIVVRG